MRRSIAWVAGIAGLLAALFLRRRKPQPQPAADPADELRRTLAARREEATASEPPPDPDAPLPADVDARRREVHEQARAAIDDMRGDAA